MDQAKIKAFEKLVGRDYNNIAGVAVCKAGTKVNEHHWNGCTASSRIHVFSVTKSVVSILIGIAIDRGYIGGVDQKVLDFFPDYRLKRGEKTIQGITLGHLLTMTAPYKYRSAPYTKYFSSEPCCTACRTWCSALLGGSPPGFGR